MPTPQEPDFPKGHPGRFDYDPESPEAIEWRRKNVHPKGERDWPVDHPKAVDTPGNRNHVPILPGVDPDRPHLEAFTGRTPEVAAAMRRINLAAAQGAKESPAIEPVIAPAPPPPGDISEPEGQPDTPSPRGRRK